MAEERGFLCLHMVALRMLINLAQVPFQISDMQHRIPDKQDHHQGVSRICTSSRFDEHGSLLPL